MQRGLCLCRGNGQCAEREITILSFFFRRVHNFVNCRHNLVIIRFFAEYCAILNLRKAGEFPLGEGKKKTMSGKRAAAWLAGIVLLGLTGCAQPVPPAAVPSGTSHTAVPERTAALEQALRRGYDRECRNAVDCGDHHDDIGHNHDYRSSAVHHSTLRCAAAGQKCPYGIPDL